MGLFVFALCPACSLTDPGTQACYLCLSTVYLCLLKKFERSGSPTFGVTCWLAWSSPWH
ncbi:protein of unknown function [Alcaligenes faecalis subsp. faecalis]|nr:protein of unknown function [Alcaligenes faecalis subsp. faecalis]